MLEVRIPSAGPEAPGPRQSAEKGRMVFQVQVRCGGRRHTLPRRYSEFHALHKRIKKRYKVPDFPSKRLPGWRTRGLEQQRLGLEAYIQGILYMNQEVPKELLEFLRLQHLPPDSKTSNWNSQLNHRPVIGFCQDPFICPPSSELLPNMVEQGVIQGLYSFSNNLPEAHSHRPPGGQGTCRNGPMIHSILGASDKEMVPSWPGPGI